MSTKVQQGSNSRKELWVYTLLWGVLFMAPVVAHFISTEQDSSQQLPWSEVLHLWRHYAVFLVIFLVHNFLLAPLLLKRQRRWLYFSLTAALLAVFAVVQCSSRPDMQHHEDHGPDAPFEHSMHKPDLTTGHHAPPLHEPGMEADRPTPPMHEADDTAGRPAPPMHDHKPMHVGQDRPPVIFGEHDVVAIIVLILMLGMNVGVKLYFRQQDDRRRMASLEKQNLEQQLQYLRYQVNPHFLMNTLNNIHALVDIDSERAKASIIDLSKIMRFVLYDGARQTVSLSRELTFVEDYIRLMRLRLTDRVKVSVSLPTQVPDAQVPPLLLITFVENAFKHGVSYRQESFIDISATVTDGQLHFSCHNSKTAQSSGQHGGVGLQNARQRLDLIYGQRYRLNIDDQPSTYHVGLVIPLSS